MSYDYFWGLADHLLKCPCMATRAALEQTTSQLPDNIKRSIRQATWSTQREYVVELARVCLKSPDGLAHLIRAIQFYDQGTLQLEALEGYTTTLPVSFPIPEPLPGVDDPTDVSGLDNPYLGLRPFTFAQQDIYAGRETEIEEALGKLVGSRPISDPLLFITGASGSGKSSFAQAGLLPALVHFFSSRHRKIEIGIFRPSNNPFHYGLRDALEQLHFLAPTNMLEIATPQNFATFIFRNRKPEQIKLLVIDQFEELFTQSDKNQAELLLNLLTNLPHFTQSGIYVIATLRSDYLPELFKYKSLYAMSKNGVELREMQQDQLKKAIQTPLWRRYPQNLKRFEPALVSRLAQDVNGEVTYLPLLQVTLEDLWNKGSLRLEAYSNLTEAIKQRAEEVYNYHPTESDQANAVYRPDMRKLRSEEEQTEITNLLLDLVSVSLDDDTRRDVRYSRLRADLERKNPIRKGLIDDLAAARLLSIEREKHINGTEVEIVDIIHESLIANWDRLKNAISERRRSLQERVRFEDALREWRENGQDKKFLLSGVRLAEARELAEQQDIALQTQEAKEFYDLSVKAEEARRRRGFIIGGSVASIIISILLIATVVSVNFGVEATNQSNSRATAQAIAEDRQKEAEHQQAVATSRELATSAIAQLQVDPLTSMQLAMKAVEITSTVQAEDALKQVVADSRLNTILPKGSLLEFSPNDTFMLVSHFVDQLPNGQFLPPEERLKAADILESSSNKKLYSISDYTSVKFSLNGRYLAYINNKTSQLTLIEANTGKQLLLQNGTLFAFTQDSKAFAFSSLNKIHVYNLEALKESITIDKSQTINIKAINFSFDNKYLICYYDNTAEIWDINDRREINVLTDIISSPQFSPNSKYLVVPYGNRLTLIEPSTGREVRTMEAISNYSSTGLVFSPDSELLISDINGVISNVWEVDTGLLINLDVSSGSNGIGGPLDYVISSDSKYILVAYGGAGSAHYGVLYNARTGEKLRTGDTDNPELKNAFTPDFKYIINRSQSYGSAFGNAISASSEAVISEVLTGKEFLTLRGHTAGIDTASYNPDGTLIVTGARDGTARLWEAKNGRLIATLLGHSGWVAAKFSPSGNYIVTQESLKQDTEIRVWRTFAGKQREFKISKIDKDDRLFCSSGQQYCAVANDNNLLIYDLTKNVLLTRINVPSSCKNNSNLAFSKDNTKILTLIKNNQVCLWEISTGRELSNSSTNYPNLLQLADDYNWEVFSIPGATSYISPDGKYSIGIDGRGNASVSDRESGKQVISYNQSIATAAFSPDKKLLAIGQDVLETKSWQVITTLNIDDSLNYDTEFSQDSKSIVTVARNGVVNVSDATSGRNIATFRNSELIYRANFSPDGRFVIGVGQTAVYIWEIQGQKLRMQILGLPNTAILSQMTLDNQKVLVAGEDYINFYICEACGKLEDLLLLGKIRTPRELSCEQRQEFLHEDIACQIPANTPTPSPPTLTGTPTNIVTTKPSFTPTSIKATSVPITIQTFPVNQLPNTPTLTKSETVWQTTPINKSSYYYSLALDKQGNIFVADRGAHRVVKYNSDGKPLIDWGTEGSGNKQFNSPTGIVIDKANNVYVADSGNNRIQKFDNAGNFIGGWSTEISPKGIALDSSSFVYVTTEAGLKKYDNSGKLVRTWDKIQGAGIAFDQQDNFYIGTIFVSGVAKYDSQGQLIKKWSAHEPKCTGEFCPSAQGGLAVDDQGNIYVADSRDGRIQKFDNNGNYILEWIVQANNPVGITVGSQGNIYVAASYVGNGGKDPSTIPPTVLLKYQNR